MNKRKNIISGKAEVFAVTALFFLALTIRIIVFFLNADNFDLDDSEPWSKINITLNWLHSSNFFPDPNFGPLHAYLIATSLYLYNNIFVSPRIVSIFFGVLFIIPFYLLVRLLFTPLDSKHLTGFTQEIAFFSTLFVCFYPLHVHISSLSLAEGPFVFFLFSALLFLFYFIKNQKIIYLIFSAVFINFASMLRFEGWVFIPVMALFLKDARLRYIFIFLVLASLFPIFWMRVNYITFGHPLNFARTSFRVASQCFKGTSTLVRLQGLYGAIKFSMGNLTLFLGIVGLIISFWLKNSRKLGIILLTIISIFIINTLRRVTNYEIKRYFVTPGLLLIPYVFYGLSQLCNMIKFKFRKLFLSISSVVLIYLALNDISRFVRISVAPADANDVINWIKEKVPSGGLILIDTKKEHPYILLKSQIGLEKFVNLNYDARGELCEKHLESLLGERTANYLLYSSGEVEFKKIFNVSLNTKKYEKHGAVFEEIYRSGRFQIFKITYNEPDF